MSDCAHTTPAQFLATSAHSVDEAAGPYMMTNDGLCAETEAILTLQLTRTNSESAIPPFEPRQVYRIKTASCAMHPQIALT